MRKKIINSQVGQPPQSAEQWLDLDKIASAEVTSESPDFPIENALAVNGDAGGWRAAEQGQQTIRIIFDRPQMIRHIRLEFVESERERTQEFTLAWSGQLTGPSSEIVRQQWNFNPQGSTSEIEDYQVNLPNVAILELRIRPELNAGAGVASLSRWRIA